MMSAKILSSTAMKGTQQAAQRMNRLRAHRGDYSVFDAQQQPNNNNNGVRAATQYLRINQPEFGGWNT